MLLLLRGKARMDEVELDLCFLFPGFDIVNVRSFSKFITSFSPDDTMALFDFLVFALFKSYLIILS